MGSVPHGSVLLSVFFLGLLGGGYLQSLQSEPGQVVSAALPVTSWYVPYGGSATQVHAQLRRGRSTCLLTSDPLPVRRIAAQGLVQISSSLMRGEWSTTQVKELPNIDFVELKRQRVGALKLCTQEPKVVYGTLQP